MAWTKQASQQYQHEWYLAHRFEIAARAKTRRKEINARVRERYRITHGGLVQPRGLTNQCGHSEEKHFAKGMCKNCYYAKIYAENREQEINRSNKWRKTNPEKAKAREHRRRARLESGGAPFTADEWFALLVSHDWKCYYCKVELTRYSASPDHLVPLSAGGSNSIVNIVPACRTCNYSKNDKPAEEFIRHRALKGGE